MKARRLLEAQPPDSNVLTLLQSLDPSRGDLEIVGNS
jgi:hypothetical protein